MCLLMADIEPLKPSNTGWLIADVVADTFAFGWARTEVDPALVALLNDPQWQPYVVFPREFADDARVVHEVTHDADIRPVKRPLFILLDGTWDEARKMFRKSSVSTQTNCRVTNCAAPRAKRTFALPKSAPCA
jgi:DTW domain-containing protein